MSKQKPPIHQLANFKIDEVSLVDRGANKQRFVVIKRETDMQETHPQPESSTSNVEVRQEAAALDDAPSQHEKTVSAPKVEQTSKLEILSGAQALAALPETLAALREMVATIQAKASVGAEPNAPREMAPLAKTAAPVARIEKRLERLEKHFCLPNSIAGEEARYAADSHVWPFDLNANRGKA